MPSTQDFLQFDHIRDGVVILRGGDLRAILMVSAINFGLKSQEEQDAITYAFQNFLNSLDFDLQILIHSRKMNVDPYLKDLSARAERQDNDLLRTQTEEYIEFIRSFVSEANIMTKQFYIIVSFSGLKARQETGGVLSAASSLFGGSRRREVDIPQFAAGRAQLLQRVEFTAQNLHQVGLRATMLATEEILELLWRLYNPEAQESGSMPEIPVEMTT